MDGRQTLTNKYVLDTYAWIEYFNESEKGITISKIIEDPNNEIFISAASYAELISKFLRENKETKIVHDGIYNLAVIIKVSRKIADSAGHIYFDEKKNNKDFGMLDAFVVATAKKLKAKILTGDPDFKNFKETIIL